MNLSDLLMARNTELLVRDAELTPGSPEFRVEDLLRPGRVQISLGDEDGAGIDSGRHGLAFRGGERSLDTVIPHAERVLYDDPCYHVSLQELDEGFVGTDGHDVCAGISCRLPPFSCSRVGGSVGGLFAAALLLRAGYEVTVYERSRRGLEGRGAGLVAQREVFAILREIGCEHVAGIDVIASERIPRSLGRDRATQSNPQTQTSWDVLFRTFRARVPEGLYLNGAAVRSIEHDADGVKLVFEDGTRVIADLVIGADSLGSVARQAVLGDYPGPTYAGMRAGEA
jgi:hypothetical protein